LYYVDTTGLKKTQHDHAMKREQFQQVEQPQLYAYDNKLHSDETHFTANDTRTAGYYGIYFRKNGMDTIYFKRDVNSFNAFNTKFHEGPVAFNKTKDVIIFTRNNFHQGKFKKDGQGVNRLKLFMAKKSGNGWGSPKEVPFNSDAYSVGHPAFDESNQFLYFASDMPGGSGGSDLYRVAYNDGVFGNPENLGDKVNTDGNELFPFVAKDILYLASDGHGGLGGLDLMAVSLKNYSQQKNMGYPINTNKDDFGLLIDESGKEGFVSSNRNRIGLDDDIYYFTRTKPVSFTTPLRVLVVDRATQNPIPMANVVPENSSLPPCITDNEGYCVFDAEPNNTHSFVGKKDKYLDGSSSIDLKEDLQDALVKIYLDEFGNSLYCLVKERGTNLPLSEVKVTVTNKKTGEKFIEEVTSGLGELRRQLANTKVGDVLNYTFRFEHPGYLSKTANFNYTIEKQGEIPVHELMDINLDKIELGTDVGKLIKINPIYFDLNKDNIRKDAAVELEKIVQVLKDNPTMVIELGSHTDCRSTAQYNMALSDRRAKSSAQYVISKGIDKSRIYGKGFGETKHVNGCACEGAVKPNCSEAEHQLNRRTEFIIVKL
jgi:outer membrane protein OmpA-like peptidoglycan-associated protein